MTHFRTMVAACLLVLGSGCDQDTQVVDSCGDGIVDPGEDCDGPGVYLQTCGTLGYYDLDGTLACAANCTWDTSDCGGHCGDGLIEDTAGEECEAGDLRGASCVSLNYTNGGVLACDGFCHFDTSACLTICGNGNVEPGEGCDDGNLDDDDGCHAVCMVQDGWQCDDASPSVCTRICGAGQTACGSDCLDLFNDPQHCGGCEAPCDDGIPCVGGVCRTVDGAWADAGSFGLDTPWTAATRHDLAGCPGGPFLYVQADGDPPTHATFQLGMTTGQWSPVPAPPLVLAEGDQLDPGLAAACLGDRKVVGYSVTNFEPAAMELVLRRYDTASMTWLSFGDAPLTTECGTTTFLDLQADPLGRLHVLSAGGWLCPDAVDYAWWDGAAWQAYPSITGDPRQLAHNATGRPAMAWWNQTNDHRRIFAVSRSAGELPDRVSEHRVLEPWSSGWSDGHTLDENPLHDGGGEDLSLASSDGYAFHSLCAAWTENVSVDPMVQEHDLYVKCYDGLTEQFIPIGDQALVSLDHRAKSPHLIHVGSTLWLAYLARELDGPDAYWHVRVVRWLPEGDAWELVGTGLEDEFTSDSENPHLLVQEGRVFLSFVEVTQDAGPRVHIKKP
ncbi:DUF4215 domain-containing protein [Myxococcota bacterium]|nr:DUF4215 domain-containing protein [Myxococcota bacterium]